MDGKCGAVWSIVLTGRMPEEGELITRISESAMRKIVGRTPSDEIRTGGRQVAQGQVRDLVQRTLDDYKSGITIAGVQLEKADPPPQVLSSFEEVQRAAQNQNKLIGKAEQYRSQILGQGRGDARGRRGSKSL